MHDNHDHDHYKNQMTIMIMIITIPQLWLVHPPEPPTPAASPKPALVGRACNMTCD